MPEKTVGYCWLPADPELTQPAPSPGRGLSLCFPGICRSTILRVGFTSPAPTTRTSTACGPILQRWAGGPWASKCTSARFENGTQTYQRFRDVFADEMAVIKRDVNGVRVEVVQYGEAGDNGIVVLDTGPGTVAVWQTGKRGFALTTRRTACCPFTRRSDKGWSYVSSKGPMCRGAFWRMILTM